MNILVPWLLIFSLIQFAAGAVQDVYNNRIAARLATAALRATNVTSDLIKPTILDFSLDLNLTTLTIVFSESVSPSTFNGSLVSSVFSVMAL